jgi:nifR3 family TIM-barrel protein
VQQGAGMVCAEMLSGVGLTRQDLDGLKRIAIDPDEHPISMQLFGGDPNILADAAAILEERGADVVDFNCGCPVKKITSQCAGSTLMTNPDLLKNIINKVVSRIKIPFTVKFRMGWDDQHINVVELAKMAEAEGAKMVAVHGRTRAQSYSGVANWDIIAQVKKAVKTIPVLASGDMFSAEAIKKCFDQTGVDGVLIARGFIGNPWIFSRTLGYLQTGVLPPEPSFEERLGMMMEHTRRMVAFKGEVRAIREMRKYHHQYIKGWPGAAELRNLINHANTFDELKQIFREYEMPLAGKEQLLAEVAV